MPCGCTLSKLARGKARDAARTRAVMCGFCPHRRGEVMDAGSTCALTGHPLTLTIRGELPCADGRHPDADGVLTWGDGEWAGVPYPLRLALRLGLVRRWYGMPRLTGGLEGCGCDVPLKAESRPPRRAFWWIVRVLRLTLAWVFLTRWYRRRNRRAAWGMARRKVWRVARRLVRA